MWRMGIGWGKRRSREMEKAIVVLQVGEVVARVRRASL